MSTHRIGVAIIFCAAFLGTSACIAQQQPLGLTYTTNYPGNQMVYGCGATYAVTGNTPQGTKMLGAVWMFQQTGPTCVSPLPTVWQDGNTGYSKSYLENCVGSFVVYAQVSYETNQSPQNPTPPLQTVVVSLAVVVPPPDGIQRPINPDTITVPLAPINLLNPNAPPPADCIATFGFAITCGRKPIGNADNISSVKENVTNHQQWNNATQSLQPVVDDINVGDLDKMGITGTSIYDQKYYPFLPGPFNKPLDTYNQELHITIPDLCGNMNVYTLGSVNVSMQYNNQGQSVITVQ